MQRGKGGIMAIQIDISQYRDRKQKGLQKIHKVGGAFAFEQKSFNPETGEELLPIIQTFDRADMQKLRDQVATQLAEIDAIIVELDTLIIKPDSKI